MAGIFAARPGQVVALPVDSLPMIIGLSGWGDGQIRRAIITGLGFSQQGNYQFLHSLRSFVFVYTFGERIGDIVISGLSFAGDCVGGISGFDGLMNYYNQFRLAAAGLPVSVAIGRHGFHAFLVGMQFSLADPELGIGQFQLMLKNPPPIDILPPARPKPKKLRKETEEEKKEAEWVLIVPDEGAGAGAGAPAPKPAPAPLPIVRFISFRLFVVPGIENTVRRRFPADLLGEKILVVRPEHGEVELTQEDFIYKYKPKPTEPDFTGEDQFQLAQRPALVPARGDEREAPPLDVLILIERVKVETLTQTLDFRRDLNQAGVSQPINGTVTSLGGEVKLVTPPRGNLTLGADGSYRYALDDILATQIFAQDLDRDAATAFVAAELGGTNVDSFVYKSIIEEQIAVFGTMKITIRVF